MYLEVNCPVAAAVKNGTDDYDLDFEDGSSQTGLTLAQMESCILYHTKLSGVIDGQITNLQGMPSTIVALNGVQIDRDDNVAKAQAKKAAFDDGITLMNGVK
jgi:hypothetical protein